MAEGRLWFIWALQTNRLIVFHKEQTEKVANQKTAGIDPKLIKLGPSPNSALLKNPVIPPHPLSIIKLPFNPIISALIPNFPQLEHAFSGQLLIGDHNPVQNIRNKELIIQNYAYCIFVTLH